MKITQGLFTFLPELTEDQIRRQVEYCLANDWVISIDMTDEIESRATYWESWGDHDVAAGGVAGVMEAIRVCRNANPRHHVRISAHDSSRGFEEVRLSFIINRPREASVFRMERPEFANRAPRYRVQPPAMERRFGGMRG
ncbi:ribulose bisphosphate carboxylase small subunit [Prosthecomicrobium sp. N25]|uniref:ribulose bisphosphate carboxylase small subunit n=1 Tax=Prosthecomicrobium sp. N25 TaxID=3129254 RepID=UPI0030769D88